MITRLQRKDFEEKHFIGLKSDLCLALSVTHCSCRDLTNVTLACEHANSKLGPKSSSPKESSNQTNCWSLVQILKIIFLLWKYLFGKDLGVECCQERRQDGWMNPSRDFDNWIWSRFWHWIRCYFKAVTLVKEPYPLSLCKVLNNLQQRLWTHSTHLSSSLLSVSTSPLLAAVWRPKILFLCEQF